MHLTATNIILRTAVERWLAVGYKRFDFDFKRIRASRRNASYVELQALSTFTCSCKLRTHTLPSDALQRSGPGAKAGGHGQPEARALTRHAPHAACLDHTGAAEKTFWEERTPVASLRSKARGAKSRLAYRPKADGPGDFVEAQAVPASPRVAIPKSINELFLATHGCSLPL